MPLTCRAVVPGWEHGMVQVRVHVNCIWSRMYVSRVRVTVWIVCASRVGRWLVGCEVRCLRGRSVRVRSQGMLWWRLMDQIKASSILLFEPVAIAKAGVGQRFMYSKNGCYLLEGVYIVNVL